MKFLKINKIKIILLIFSVILGISSKSMAMVDYQEVDAKTGIVIGTIVNIRQGPGKTFRVITKVKKNAYIRIFAKIGDWYVVQTNKSYVGTISSKYVKLIYPKSTVNKVVNTSNTTSFNKETGLTTDEQDVLDLINETRKENGLAQLKIDEELQNIARVKARDIVDNNYFSHNSSIYGTPFDMIKKFGINYKIAGENIAGSPSNEAAVDSWMDSKGHKTNILNDGFSYTGIGVVKSAKYGKIYVQMFIDK